MPAALGQAGEAGVRAVDSEGKGGRLSGRARQGGMRGANANGGPGAWAHRGGGSGACYSIPSFLIRYRSARKLIPRSFAAAVLL